MAASQYSAKGVDLRNNREHLAAAAAAAAAAPVEVDSNRILPCRHGEHRRRSGEQPGVLGEDTHVQRCGHQDQPQGRQNISCIRLCTGAAEEKAAREEADENLKSVI